MNCAKYGFGSYTTTVEGDTTHFIADTYSEKTDRITWVGTISGSNIGVRYQLPISYISQFHDIYRFFIISPP